MIEDVESTQRIPCAGAHAWELSDRVADAQLPDSVTLVRAAPKVTTDARPSARTAPRRPSWRPERRSQLPAAPECPTLRQEIPRELLRMLRAGGQRRDDGPAPMELHDTDECPTADLSEVDDLEWLDD